MLPPAQVSLIGNSQLYLDVRANVLQHFWLVETIALDMGEVPRFETDLVVVCSSVPEGERQVWVDRARSHAPTMLIVRLDGFDSGPMAGADATVDDSRGPGALVSTIYELLTERGLGSRGWPKLIEGEWVQ